MRSDMESRRALIGVSCQIIFIFMLVATVLADVSGAGCDRSITFTQLSREAVCDGNPFTVRLDNKNGWDGYDEVIFSPSEGINFISYPDVLLGSAGNTIDMTIICNNIDNGYIDANIMSQTRPCSIRLELKSLYLPLKNAQNETILASVSEVKEKTNRSPDPLTIAGIALTLVFVAVAIILIRYISRNMRHKKQRKNKE